MGIPYVITFHALGMVRQVHQKEMDKFPAERNNIERFLTEDADAIIAECPQDKEDLVIYYGAESSKIAIVPCGFSKKEFYPLDKLRARKRLNINPNEIILLQLGRLVPRKGIDNVIKSLAYLKQQKKVRLLIVGGSTDVPDPSLCPELRRLQQIASADKVETSVIFTGRKNRPLLKYYYAAADIFITTPWYEPFGITPLEAMACGTPVIGADVGGIKYSVEHGKTGFLVPPKDPVALAENIEKLIKDPSMMEAMGKNALLRVNKFFTWKKVAESMVEIYKQYRPVATGYGFKNNSVLKVNFGIKKIGKLLNEQRFPNLKIQP